GDRCSGETARRHGARYFAESPEAGDLNRAVEIGVGRLRELDAQVIAVIPADLPLIDPAELDHAVREAIRLDATVVVPDWHGKGTNALIFPASAPPVFEFGPGSFQRH